jgi:hypothetical protein
MKSKKPMKTREKTSCLKLKEMRPSSLLKSTLTLKGLSSRLGLEMKTKRIKGKPKTCTATTTLENTHQRGITLFLISMEEQTKELLTQELAAVCQESRI